MSKQYIIVGANGQLGRALAQRYPEAMSLAREAFNISDPEAYSRIDWSKYSTILNAAAMTNVDHAETPEGRAEAWSTNAFATALLAKTATDHGLTLVHVSTDYVFDGSKALYAETDIPSPLSVYGQSKAAGDMAVMVSPKHFLLRTSWVVGEGTNFVKIMTSLAHKGVKPRVVSDQVGRLTFVPILVNAIDHLLTTQAAFGTYNCSNDGDVVSWADVAKATFEHVGKDRNDITEVTTEEYFAGKNNVAKRPASSSFDLHKLINTGFAPTDWRIDLKAYVEAEERALA